MHVYQATLLVSSLYWLPLPAGLEPLLAASTTHRYTPRLPAAQGTSLYHHLPRHACSPTSSYPTLPYPTLSYPTLPYPTLPLPYPTLP